MILFDGKSLFCFDNMFALPNIWKREGEGEVNVEVEIVEDFLYPILQSYSRRR